MVSVASAICSMLLPETKDSDMYNDIEDLERAAALRNKAQLRQLQGHENGNISDSNDVTASTNGNLNLGASESMQLESLRNNAQIS
jgi:hypothetical protein